MSALANRLFARLLLLVALLVSAGCVTTQSGGVSKAAPPEEALQIRVAAAKQYLQNRDFEAARRHLRVALESNPRSPDVHDALALTFHYSGELELAEKHYKKAVSLGDGASRYRVNYASYLLQLERFEDAERQLEAVVDDSLYEKRETALVMLGMAQQQLLKSDQAMRSFERALVLKPRNAPVLRELAIMKFEQGDTAAAWQYFQSYRSITARPTPEMLLLGIKLAQQLDKSDAEASYVLALKNLYPQSREYASYLRSQQYGVPGGQQ